MNERKLTINIPGIGTVEGSKAFPLPAHFRRLAGQAVSPRQDFWRRKDWPDDFNGQVFLGRAVQQMGRSVYAQEWTGYEPEAPEAAPPALDAMEILVPDPLAKAALSDLYQYGGVAAPVRDRHVKFIRHYDAKHWEAAVQLRAAVIDAIAPPISRFAGAVLALRNAMRSGALKYSLLIDETGEYTPALPVNYWNTLSYGSRFYFCKMHPLQPISDAVAGAGFRWLFVDADDLARLTSPIETASPSAKLGPKTPQERKAEKEAINWLWAVHVSKSKTRPADVTKATLLAEIRKQDFWPKVRQSARTWDTIYTSAWQMGKGQHDAWGDGDAR